MGNAVDALYKKKLEQRKKQTAEERKIFQACIGWSIKQEELRKQEALAKRERVWKERELARLKRDKDLMERYISNIESGKKQKGGDLKDRERMIEERKKLKSSMSERRMRQWEEHLEEESTVMAKYLDVIEKRSEKSREAMKMRIITLARKKDKDHKEFVHRTTIANQERKREIENSKRRIKYMEKRIVQERVQWQAKLMAARGIDKKGKRVSSRQLWEIGRKTVEKKRKEYLNTITEGDTCKNKVHRTEESNEGIKESPLTRKESTKVADVRKTLLTTNIEGSDKLNSPKNKGEVVATVAPNVNTKEKTDNATRQFNLNQYRRFYLPQGNDKVTANRPTNLSNILESESNSSSIVERKNPDKTVDGFSRNKVTNDRHVPMPKTLIDNSTNGKEKKISTKLLTYQKKETGTEQVSLQETKEEAIENDNNSEKPKQEASDVFSRLYKDGSNTRTKQIDTNSTGKRNIDSKPQGTSRTKQLHRKAIVSLFDPLIGKSNDLKQSEVEKVLEIRSLSYKNDTRSRSNSSSSTRASNAKTMLRVPYENKSEPEKNNIRKLCIKDNTKDDKLKGANSLVPESKSVKFQFEFSSEQTIKSEKETTKAQSKAMNKDLKERSNFSSAKTGTASAGSRKFLKGKDQSKFVRTPNITFGSKNLEEDDTKGQSPKIKIPQKARSNLYLDSSPEMFVLDKRISEVQRRIDNMVKSKA